MRKQRSWKENKRLSHQQITNERRKKHQHQFSSSVSCVHIVDAFIYSFASSQRKRILAVFDGEALQYNTFRRFFLSPNFKTNIS